MSTTENSTEEPNEIYSFVGGDIWGYNLDYIGHPAYGDEVVDITNYKREKIIRGELPDKTIDKDLRRASFKYLTQKVLGEEFKVTGKYANYVIVSMLNEKTANEIVNMTLCSKYTIDNGDSSFLSSNSTYRKTAEFNIDEILISSIDLDYLYTRSGFNAIKKANSDKNSKEIACMCENTIAYIKSLYLKINERLIKTIVANIELSSYIQQFCEMKANIRNAVEDQKGYFIYFFSNIEKALGTLVYISSLNQKVFTEIEFRNELAELFAKCLQAKPVKSKSVENQQVENQPVNANLSVKLLNIRDKIDSIFSLSTPYSENFDEIKVINRKCSIATLLYKMLTLSKNVSHYGLIDQKIIYYLKIAFEEIMTSNLGDKDTITDIMRNRYNTIAKEVISEIESIKTAQK